MTVKVKLLRTHDDAKAPYKGSKEAAGWDLYSVEDVELPAGHCRVVDTGWQIAIPEGYEGQVRPRSGLAAKENVTVLNSPGTIDSDYRGPLKVILMNQNGVGIVRLTAGTRIAQLVVQEVPKVGMEEVSTSEWECDTERGEGGFGSTGTA